MRNEYFFKVAGLLFSVTLPGGWDVETLLPSFRPFRCGAYSGEERIFRLIVITQPFVDDVTPTELLGESYNDMGHVRLLRDIGGYRVEIADGSVDNSVAHVMVADFNFDCAVACLRPEAPSVGAVLSSMIRILYAQAVLGHDGVSVHASCVSVRDRSFLFLGKSGTGKSTHARRWMEAFPDCRLLNDDNPVLRIADGVVTAYGTPWSGKTPCYKDECCPVAGIVRLQQSGTNRFTPLEGPEAFAALLPSCSVIRQDARLLDMLYRTLIQVSEQVDFGWMECLPDREAALLCFDSLVRKTTTAAKRNVRP